MHVCARARACVCVCVKEREGEGEREREIQNEAMNKTVNEEMWLESDPNWRTYKEHRRTHTRTEETVKCNEREGITDDT